MTTVGNINKDITSDPNHVRVNYKSVFLGKGVVKELGLSEGDYVEFITDRNDYLWLKKSSPNYGHRLIAIGRQLYIGSVHLARELANIAYTYPDDLCMKKKFEPFVLLTTKLTTDLEQNQCVEVFTSRIFRTRMYYEKKNKI